MKRPKKLKIVDIACRVKYSKQPIVDGASVLWGAYNSETKKIEVYDRDIPLSAVRQILLHEILHAMGERLDIKQLVGDDDNLVDRIATGLNLILAENPELLAMFKEKDE